MITILGLGPGKLEHLTLEAWRILESAEEIYLRTARHPLVEKLDIRWHSFDMLYDSAEDFNSLYQEIAQQIVELGQRPGGVIYAVPGHPFVGENTPALIQKLAAEKSVPVKIIEGLSFIEPVLTLLALDGIEGVQLHDAVEIANMYHPPLNPDQPAILAQVYSQHIASHLKLTLMNQYPDDYPVKLLHGAGTDDARVEVLPLYEIDRSPHIAHLTTLYIPPASEKTSFAALQEVMAHLRAPDGCPWDQKQTHETLRPYLLEEAYEVLETIDDGDIEALSEELGDLMLQIVFHSQIGVEDGTFAMTDVLSHIITKMIRRHPHVWGDVKVTDAQNVVSNWEKIKQEENAGKTRKQSLLDGVPVGLPALVQALRIQEKAAGVGFDWPDITPIIAKIHEEIEEVQQAEVDELSGECGDLLFAVVNWIRRLDVDPESALRETNLRFKKRFAYIEEQVAARGQSLQALSLEELDKLWDEAKAKQVGKK